LLALCLHVLKALLKQQTWQKHCPKQLGTLCISTRKQPSSTSVKKQQALTAFFLVKQANTT